MTRLALHILFFLSGAAALGYQLVWAKMFSTGLGHEMPAVLAIIAAFMAGMALGAWALDRFIPRDARAGYWLAGLEMSIGVWAMLTSWFIPSVNDFALRLIGLDPGALKHWLIAFALPAIALLPATAAIGATLPAMEKFLSTYTSEKSSIGSVYAANTLGAVAGTLATPFLLMPALGFSKSCWMLAALNAAASLGAWILARLWPQFSLSPQRGEVRGEGWEQDGASTNASATERTTPHPHSLSPLRGERGRKNVPLSPRRLALTLFCTGLLGITYETAGVRVLSQVLEGTVFTYATVLAVFLFGTAAGAASYHRWWRNSEPRRLLATLLCGTALACLMGMLLLTRAPWLHQFARGLGDSTPGVLVAELLVAATAFVLPTFGMGATFSHLVQQGRAVRGHVGSGVALNTLGGALAPALCGVVLIPIIGTKWTLLLVGLGYSWLAPPWPNFKVTIPCVLACVWALFSNLYIISVPPGGSVVAYREGVMASVAVLADTNGQRTLRVDNRFQMGGTAAADTEYRQAHLPLLLHPNPQRALFLGVGTGISLGAASLYPQLKADAVELVPQVVAVMPLFESKNFSVARRPDFKLHTADARRFVRASHQQYDVIIADLFHPYRDGAGALYTREHFAAIRRQLDPNTASLFCQWLPLHQLDEPTLRVIVRTFESVFPNCEAWLLRFNVEVPVVALVGWTGVPRWSPTQVELRAGEPRLGGELKRLALADSLRLQGHLLADMEDLHRFAGTAPLNTDDNQRVTFMAPRAAYEHDAKPYASLLALMADARTASVTALDRFPSGENEFAVRLARYLAARHVYLRGMIHDTEQRHDEAIEAYLESARLSPDFTSGYAQCLTIANAFASSDPARTRKILEGLMEARPDRTTAAELLRRLFTP